MFFKNKKRKNFKKWKKVDYDISCWKHHFFWFKDKQYHLCFVVREGNLNEMVFCKRISGKHEPYKAELHGIDINFNYDE